MESKFIFLKIKHFVSILSLMLCVTTEAQILNPIHWSGEKVGDSIRVVARVDEGWHFNIMAIGDSVIDCDPLSGEGYHDNFSMMLASAVDIRYIACNDKQCLAPEIWRYTGEGINQGEISGTSDFGEGDEDKSNLIIFLLGLLGGFMAIFTPCIWPIIPMTVSFFLKKQTGSREGLYDAILYGLSIIVIYVSLGLLITIVFGASALNAISTNAIVNIFFFLLLVVFSLSFFGLFEITLPESWSTSLDAKARSTGGKLSILFMAFTLVIVSFSCTGPIIGTLLVEAAGKSLFTPTVGMLGFSIALALPFSLFALFPNVMKKMPKSGNWMNIFKVTLAFVELALSLKFLSVADLAYGWGILPRPLFIALWIGCFGGLAIYLLYQAFKAQGMVGKIIIICLALLSSVFTAYLIPGLWGAPVKMIAAFAPPQHEHEDFYFNFEKGLQQAKLQNKEAIVIFTGYGCVNCRKMDEHVIDHEIVQKRLKDFIVIKLYVDDKQYPAGDKQAKRSIGDINSALQREKFSANSQPFYVRVDKNGNQIGKPMYFTTDVDKFMHWLE